MIISTVQPGGMHRAMCTVIDMEIGAAVLTMSNVGGDAS